MSDGATEMLREKLEQHHHVPTVMMLLGTVEIYITGTPPENDLLQAIACLQTKLAEVQGT